MLTKNRGKPPLMRLLLACKESKLILLFHSIGGNYRYLLYHSEFSLWSAVNWVLTPWSSPAAEGCLPDLSIVVTLVSLPHVLPRSRQIWISLPLEALLLLLVFSLLPTGLFFKLCEERELWQKAVKKIVYVIQFQQKSQGVVILISCFAVHYVHICHCFISFPFLRKRKQVYLLASRTSQILHLWALLSAQNLAPELTFDCKWHLWNEPALLFHLLSGALRYNSNTSSYIALWIDWHTSLVC